MIEPELPPVPPVESPAERAEKAAIRRRWIGLAEWVGIAALLVSVGGLWLAWSDRRVDQAEKASESADKSLITYTASRSGRGAVLDLSDPDHKIQQIDVAFPPSLGVKTQTGMIQPHISAKWFERELLAATDKGADNREGKLPVLITTIWWEGSQRKTDRAIYQIVWQTTGRLFQGRALNLDAASLAERGGSPARLDELWKAERPAN